jgi:hypothetical protein
MKKYKVGGKLNGADVEKVDIYEVCAFLKETVDVLDYPRRVKAKTELSTGSLHHHLKELLRADFIYKTSGRPGRYGRTDAITHLKSLVGGDADQMIVAGEVESEQMNMGAAEELMEH